MLSLCVGSRELRHASNGVQACGVILTLIFTIAVEYVFSDSSSSGEDDDDGGASTRYM